VGKGSGSGMTRGDRRRNARRERLRELLPRDGVVIGIDLGEDKQAVALVDHDGRVLARKTVQVKASGLGEVLRWAAGQARTAMFTHVTVACEPTGSRWLHVQMLCRELGLPLVCVQPLVSHIAREQQDLTPHKTDESDCVMIGRLAAELHCYIPEELEESWAYLRQLGRRRTRLITMASASVQRIREFLAVAWPAVTGTCVSPFDSMTWLAALQVVTSRCGGDPGRLASLGVEEFTVLVRAGVRDWGGQRAWGPVCARIFAVLASTEGVVVSHRRGMLRRCADELGDLQRTRAQLRAAETDMAGVLGELGLARLADIPGLAAVGAAAILAETGDPRQFQGSSSLVKHAGLAPAENSSGTFQGEPRISRRGRPALRTAAWRAVLPLLAHNPVTAAKYAAMTAAAEAAVQDAATPGQARAAQAKARAARAKARVACAASLLRWIWSLTVNGTCWDPRIAAGQLSHHHAIAA
jgi:transposase